MGPNECTSDARLWYVCLPNFSRRGALQSTGAPSAQLHLRLTPSDQRETQQTTNASENSGGSAVSGNPIQYALCVTVGISMLRGQMSRTTSRFCSGLVLTHPLPRPWSIRLLPGVVRPFPGFRLPGSSRKQQNNAIKERVKATRQAANTLSIQSRRYLKGQDGWTHRCSWRLQIVVRAPGGK